MKCCTSIILFALCISFVTSSGKNLSKASRFEEDADSPRYSFAVGNSTYAVTNTMEIWQRSKFECKWIGMELVSIETEEEALAIQKAMEGFKEEYFWIGLSNGLANGGFYWESTGQLLGPYTNWGALQPAELDCVALVDIERTWQANLCSIK